ncbi:hypothetical protein D3C71_196890 [compost metagenome]
MSFSRAARDYSELPAILRTEARIDGEVFPIDRIEFDAAGVVRSLSVDELEALVVAMDTPGARIDWLAERAGVVPEKAIYTVLLDGYDLASFMLKNGLDCPSADKNPERYEDGEVVGWASEDHDPATGAILRWNQEASAAEVDDQTIDEFGFHRLRGREVVQLGLDYDAHKVATVRVGLGEPAVSYSEALEIAGELREGGMSLTRPR